MNKKNYSQIACAAILFSGIITPILWSQYTKKSQNLIEGVSDYEPTDKPEAVKFFNEDHYLLSRSDLYDMDHLFDTKSPNLFLPEYFGQVSIKVVRENNKLAGWISYYKKSQYEGTIHILVVGKEYRKKGYAKKLIKTAEQDLGSRGIVKIKIAVRLCNDGALKLYEYMGYEKINSNESFAFYEKCL